MTPGDASALIDQLTADVARWQRVAVAFSGGVDSAVVAAIAHRALGDAAVAVTATSPALATGELIVARNVAVHIGIRHDVIHTDELADPRYRRNPADRCYFCKSHLYDTLAAQYGPGVTILSGTNTDDLGDWRPGLRAAAERGIEHPLSSAGVTKAQVRIIADAFGLPNAHKPASPCLASRIPYGSPVSAERLHRIDRAEGSLRGLGLREFRVRDHGRSATVEISSAELPAVTDAAATTIAAAVIDAGYADCSVSDTPLRSGSLNLGLPGLRPA